VPVPVSVSVGAEVVSSQWAEVVSGQLSVVSRPGSGDFDRGIIDEEGRNADDKGLQNLKSSPHAIASPHWH
jgi:hypothetical protein